MIRASVRSFWSVGTLLSIFLMVSVPSAHAGFFPECGFCKSIFKIFSAAAEADELPDAPSISLPLMGSQAYVAAALNEPRDSAEEDPLPVTQNNALVSPRNPMGVFPNQSHDQILIYTVQSGDTPGFIAERFGISLNTLLWANNLRTASRIKQGDELVILPVTGVQYEIKKGDTLESIAKRFRGDAGEIVGYNGLLPGEPLEVGGLIIIPDGELIIVPQAAPQSVQSRFAGLPEFSGYYMRPVIGGRNARVTKANPHGIHGYNGVDLSNSCGLPVLASADGTVIVARTTGWNGGYGKYVVIAHPNGTQTLYGHLNVIAVSPGQSVSQGSRIAAIGSTGNSTGCHVHFEIRGARNPF